jgi:hypothetical protein
MNRDQRLDIQQKVYSAWVDRFSSTLGFNEEDPTPEQADALQYAMAEALGPDSPEAQWLKAVEAMTEQEKADLIALYATLKSNPS